MIDCGKAARTIQQFYELARDQRMEAQVWHALNNQAMVHFHGAVELILVEEGALMAIQEGKSRLVSTGEIIVNSSYMIHGYTTPDYAKTIVATIPLATVPSLQNALSQKKFAAEILGAEEAAECARLLQLAAEPAHERNPFYMNGLNLAVLALLIEKIGLKEKAPSAESDLVREILIYLQDHFAEELTVAGTAARFGYSAGRFSHIFNARVGCSFTRYINGLRCRMAEKLLRESGLPLTDVASACGFSSLRTFHRVYREYAGHTPRWAKE